MKERNTEHCKGNRGFGRVTLSLLLPFLVLTADVSAQGNLTGTLRNTNPDDHHAGIMNVKSPTAAGMERKSAYNVDLYTGALSLNLPLLSTSHADIQVPITLSYTGDGVRVDEYSGWVGLGWNLQAGGMISRKTNDIADEFYNRSTDLLSGGSIGRDAGFYFIGKTLDRTDWSSVAFLRSKIDMDGTVPINDSIVDLEPDEFVFSFGGYSGSFYRSETGEWKVKSKQNLTLEIEEIIDNSGNFRLWSRFNPTTDNDNPHMTSTNNEKVASLFTQFTITTPDGFRYIFGGDTMAIEFSRGTVPGYGDFRPFEDKRNFITANTWYLTKIISPQGEIVTFEYKPARVLFRKFIYREPEVHDAFGSSFYSGPYKMSGVAVNQTFLKAIHTPSIRIDFFVNNSTELPLTPNNYVMEEPTLLKQHLLLNWIDLSYEHGETNFPNNMRKLDSIKVYDKQKGAYANGIRFHYRQDVTQRKTLDSVEFYDFKNRVRGELYKFGYNAVNGMPPYESVGRDHWGFLRDPSLTNLYTHYAATSREPHPSHCLRGLLYEIHYPSGGYSLFEYEPAYYRDYIKINPNSSTPVTLESYTTQKYAGIRIKSIKDYPLYGSDDPLTTNYFYTKDYISGGTYSSGVLGMLHDYSDAVTYVMNNSGSLAVCSGTYVASNTYLDATEYLQQYRGGIVNYSEVAVQHPDGGTTVTYFSNHDQPEYRDELHTGYAAMPSTAESYIKTNYNFRITSNDLERGNVLRETLYNSANQKVKETKYQYLDDPSRKNNFVKSIATKLLYTVGTTCVSTWGTVGGPRAWAYKVYTYQNPLSSIREANYLDGDSLVTVRNFTFDAYGNLVKETSMGSDGKEYINNYKYNIHPDYSGTATTSEAQGIKKLFSTYKIKNQLIEQNMILRDFDLSVYKVLGAKLYTYSNTSPPRLDKVRTFELASPMSLGSGITVYPMSKFLSGALSYHANFKVQSEYADYSKLGMPRTIRNGNENTTITLDNKGRHAVSVTKNAAHTEVAYANFEGAYLSDPADENKGNWTFDLSMLSTDPLAPMGSGCYILRSTSGSLGGIVSSLKTLNSLASGKKYFISFWVKEPTSASPLPILTTPSASFAAPELIKTVNGWSYYEGTLTGNGQQLTISIPYSTTGSPMSRQNFIDEVRLYPVTAAMSSFVRDPLTGMVMMVCDESGNIRRYEADGFRRLTTVRDELDYIEEVIEYKFQATN